MVLFNRGDEEMMARANKLFVRLIETAARNGWGEYRTHTLWYDDVAKSYGFNNNALLRWNETVKDAVDPKGIIAQDGHLAESLSGPALVKRVAVIASSLTAMLTPAAAAQREAAPAQPDSRADFLRYCGGCHLERGFGTNALARRVAEGQAKLEDRADLTAEYVRTAVRHGIGSMPAIRHSELDPARLDGIAAYLGRGRRRRSIAVNCLARP